MPHWKWTIARTGQNICHPLSEGGGQGLYTSKFVKSDDSRVYWNGVLKWKGKGKINLQLQKKEPKQKWLNWWGAMDCDQTNLNTQDLDK